jgi:hypothetical protein
MSIVRVEGAIEVFQFEGKARATTLMPLWFTVAERFTIAGAVIDHVFTIRVLFRDFIASSW